MESGWTLVVGAEPIENILGGAGTRLREEASGIG